MKTRKVAAAASVVGVATVALVLVLSGGSPAPSPSKGPAAGNERATAGSSAASRSGSERQDCSSRSEAQFPAAFTNPANLVVGPLVLMGGGTYTEASAVREYGGNKFALLVKAGHTVTVQVAPRGRRVAGLFYSHGPSRTLNNAATRVTFIACRPGRAPRRYSPNGPSESSADGVAVTFWSGFVLTRTPSCVPLDIYVDKEPSPRRVGLSLGRRCPR